jgi:hypothetical protein
MLFLFRKKGPIIRRLPGWFIAGTFAALATSVMLAGCATPLQIGGSAKEVVAARGQPSAKYSLPGGGERWAYAATFGQQTTMVDFDAAGKVASTFPALNDAGFSKIRVGEDGKQDIARAFGPPAEVGMVGWSQYVYEVWSYRYKQADVVDAMMHVHFGGDGKVAKVYGGPDLRRDRINTRD